MRIMSIMGIDLPGQSLFEPGVMFACAAIGLAMRSSGFAVAYLIVGGLPGNVPETSLRQPMLLYKSDLRVIFDNPIALDFFVFDPV